MFAKANPRWRSWESSRNPKLTHGFRKPENPMKEIALSEVKDELSKYLRLAEKEEIVITRHGKPAGVLIGFASEDDWFDYRLEHDERFLSRIEHARESLRRGRGVRLEDVR
jgi:prevent-host-death family protein